MSPMLQFGLGGLPVTVHRPRVGPSVLKREGENRTGVRLSLTPPVQWRCRESNPGPKDSTVDILQA